MLFVITPLITKAGDTKKGEVVSLSPLLVELFGGCPYDIPDVLSVKRIGGKSAHETFLINEDEVPFIIPVGNFNVSTHGGLKVAQFGHCHIFCRAVGSENPCHANPLAECLTDLP